MNNIIFDVDKTLIDSSTTEINAMRIALKSVLGRNYSYEDIASLSVLTTDDFFNKFNITHNDRQLVEDKWNHLLEINPINCFPGIIDTIKELHSDKKKLFIVTSRKKEEVETLLNGNLSAILPYFNSVITSDMVKNHKPSPDSLLKLIYDNNLNPKETIYIGDGIVDSDTVINTNVELNKNGLDGIAFGYAMWDKHDNYSNFKKIDYSFEKPTDIPSVLSKKGQKIKNLH